jgi:hypothetical protein
MSSDPLSALSPTSPTRNRRLLSKFTNHFGNRNRNISEFYIQPDDPWRSYSPGDVVKGMVILTVVKPIRITHLVVCLYGYVKVFKNEVAPRDGAEDWGFLGTGRGRRHSEYLGNGFASLFEDEVVLCGEGRLKEGIYKFKFELEFPPYGLPSSISVCESNAQSCRDLCGSIRLKILTWFYQFERGTISYMITSTLTRPTTICPTISCDKRITLLEAIDVAPLAAPKPRVISLEPVSKRSKTRSKTKVVSAEQISAARSSLEPQPNESEPPVPLSPVPSELSNSSSCVSTSTQSFQIVSESTSVNSASWVNGENKSSSEPLADKTITATTEILRSGVLPGDVLPIIVSIDHTKPIRSPNGIIVTLYRQGRIDMHPAIPVGTPEKGKKPVYEDYYPKSRTGLGGLSFGATRTSSVFRKDLSQTFAPLIVDPNKMNAVVKTSIRIPEDIFPTITRVPGSMISFRYYIEVVMDLGGKLGFPRFNMMAPSNNYNCTPSGQVLNLPNRGRYLITSSLAGNILDTDQIRREKGVVACVFEIIIGSKDTGRGQHQPPDGNSTSDELPSTPQTVHRCCRESANGHHQVSESSSHSSHQDRHPQDEYDVQSNLWPTRLPVDQHPQNPRGPAQPEEVDEKTRLRRAEEMLLPSQPYLDDEIDPSALQYCLPSAPNLCEQHHLGESHTGVGSACLSGPQPPLTPSISFITGGLTAVTPGNLDSPPHSSNGGESEVRVQLTSGKDDKQELERQRLLAAASAPDPQHQFFGESDSYDRSAVVHPEFEFEPSAPILTDEDIMTQPSVTGESLPRYQQ